MAFGRRVCGVANPEASVHNIAQAMSETLQQAKTDERIAPPLRSAISTAWEAGLEQAMQPKLLAMGLNAERMLVSKRFSQNHGIAKRWLRRRLVDVMING